MIPLIVLIVVLLLARGIGAAGFRPLNSWRAATRAGLAAMFLFTAVAHFNSMRQDMINMVPPWVPNPGFIVTLTGICEIAGAVGLIMPSTRRAAAIGLILFLISVFPANVYAAQTGVTIGGQPATALLPRGLMQVLFIWMIWWSGLNADRHKRAATKP